LNERIAQAVFQKYSEEVEKHMVIFYRNLSEKEKRSYAALETEKLGYGGQKYICRLLRCSPTTLRVGREELLHGSSTLEGGIRKSGGGRKKIREKIEGIDEMFLEIMKENTAGSPMNEEVKWTNLGLRGISKAFKEKGYEVSEYVVKQLFKKHKYGKRKMQKTKTVKEAAQRNEQFENIKDLRERYTKEENPIMSVDVKKRDDRHVLP
jgi:hypothetical protein